MSREENERRVREENAARDRYYASLLFDETCYAGTLWCNVRLEPSGWVYIETDEYEGSAMVNIPLARQVQEKLGELLALAAEKGIE